MWLEEEVSSWEDRYILSRYLYGIAEETIDDRKYTTLHKAMIERGSLPEYTSRSWSSDPVPVDLLKKYGKDNLIKKYHLTERTESIPSLGSFEEMAREIQPVFERGYLSEKNDGWNYQITYSPTGDYKVSNTRGRTGDPVFMETKLPCVPDHIEVEEARKEDIVVVGEASLDNDKFEELKRMFPHLPAKSQRSSVATAIANPQALHLLSFRAIEIKGLGDADKTIELFNKWGFDTPMFTPVNEFFELYGLINKFAQNPEILKRSTDGLVYWKARGGYRRALRVGHWEEKVHYSFIIGYNESYNAHNISQSLAIYPIERAGGTQRQVNITNWRRIIEYGLKIGTPIAFIIKSDSTADIDEVETRRLQEKWYGKYELYKQKIIRREAIK